jgi:prepilin-type N-terminal cleavage/methylation domain-containing protein
MMRAGNRGFSLLEISLVLMIIALLVGGILIGRDMVRSAQMRSVLSEAQTLMQAIKNFQAKYDALPGDFAGASNLWSASCDSNSDGTVSAADTGNGDGNGRVMTQGTAATYYEQFCVWTHLTRASLIETSFTGRAGNLGAMHRIPGTNVPISKLQPGGWALVTVTIGDITGGFNQVLYTAPESPPDQVLWFGGASTTGTNNLQRPVLRPEEARVLDTKIDDGMPGLGKVLAQDNTPGTVGVDLINDCHLSNNAYNLAANNTLCTLVFKTGL